MRKRYIFSEENVDILFLYTYIYVDIKVLTTLTFVHFSDPYDRQFGHFTFS